MSIFKIFKPSFILNGFNTPGSPEGRANAAAFDALGVKQDALTSAVVNRIQNPTSVEEASAQGKVILMAAGAVGILLLLTGKRRR